MNKLPTDFEIIPHNYETGSKPIPGSLLNVWESVEPEVRNDMKILAYEEDDVQEIRFSSPNIIACPNSEEGIEKVLKEGKVGREKMFEQLSITDNRFLQLAFYIYNEHCHLLQFKRGKLKPFQPNFEVKELEKEADEYAYKKIAAMQQKS
ncbi:hypothetical protein HYV12_00685 [Candidatus Dojkabacteria bacterium]|nr:hypothetical protein [Candidatus Dojkabacteria bacterium]